MCFEGENFTLRKWNKFTFGLSVTQICYLPLFYIYQNAILWTTITTKDLSELKTLRYLSQPCQCGFKSVLNMIYEAEFLMPVCVYVCSSLQRLWRLALLLMCCCSSSNHQFVSLFSLLNWTFRLCYSGSEGYIHSKTCGLNIWTAERSMIHRMLHLYGIYVNKNKHHLFFECELSDLW